MNEDPDFNIDNYGLNDLLDIFNIDSPTQKDEIMSIASDLIEKYKNLNQNNYVEFFSKAMNKLISNYSQVEGIIGKIENIVDDIHENKETITDAIDDFLDSDEDDAGPNVLSNQYYNSKSLPENIGERVMPNRGEYISVPEEGVDGHAPQLQQRLMMPNTFSKTPYSQGHRNPTLQNSFVSWINIDSQYREIKSTGIATAQCNPSNENFVASNNYEQNDSSTDFLFTLQHPITNVMGMAVKSIEVPMAGYYAYSNNYGNTYFDLIQEFSEDPPISACIRIPEGNYTSEELMNIVNERLKKVWTDSSPNGFNNPALNYPIMRINNNNQKVYFSFYPTMPDPVPNVKIRWHNRNITNGDEIVLVPCNNLTNQCLKRNTGKKINSTLGWSLGFREEESEFRTIDKTVNIVSDPSINEISGNTYYGVVGQGIWNKMGTKYLILEIDDFNRNRNSGSMGTMTMPRATEVFKLPKYAKELSETYPVCKDSSGIYQNSNDTSHNKKFTHETFKRANRKGTPATEDAIKGIHTLTEAQKYTAKELYAAQKNSAVDQYHAPQSSDIIFRFPIDRTIEDIQKPIIIQNTDGLSNGRKYFGPVNIEKLRIRLLDDRGHPVDLNGGDFSFSLVLERLYQY